MKKCFNFYTANHQILNISGSSAQIFYNRPTLQNFVPKTANFGDPRKPCSNFFHHQHFNFFCTNQNQAFWGYAEALLKFLKKTNTSIFFGGSKPTILRTRGSPAQIFRKTDTSIFSEQESSILGTRGSPAQIFRKTDTSIFSEQKSSILETRGSPAQIFIENSTSVFFLKTQSL